MEIHDVQKQEGQVHTPESLMQDTMAKVESYLKDAFPDYVSFGDGSFTIQRGSATVMIVVRPFTDKETVVECMSNLVVGATITPELMQFLLRKTVELHLGGFGLLFDDTITFSYTITGANLDAAELKTAVDTVAIIADHYDDVIAEMSGGTLASEAGILDLES